MAFTQEQEAQLLELLAAFENGKRINELEPSEGLTGSTLVEVMDASGETRRMELERAVAEAGNPIAGRWWDESKATTKAGGWFGSLEALRRLPATLGLGRYLVADDRTMRKLDPMDSRRFEDGSPAALDGSMGQCMWCWSRPWYFTHWREGDIGYYAITLKPLEGRKSYRIPAGGVSWLGAAVMDRREMKLCSVISEEERYRGGSGTARPDIYPNKPAADAPQASMLGMAATLLSTTNFGTFARRRGEGWEANWFVAQAAVEILLLVIMGERNMQVPYSSGKDVNGLYQGGFGAGVTTLGSAAIWNNYNGYYPLVPTEVGVELGDRNGLVEYAVPGPEGSDEPLITFQVPCFLGLMHAGFGHLWRWVRGITISQTAGDKSEVYVAKSMYADFNPNSVDNMLKVAECPQTGGYIKRKSWEGLCAMPTVVGGSPNTYYTDYFYTNGASQTGLRVRAAGGRASDGTPAGVFATHADFAAAAAYETCTSPLCFFEEDPTIEA